MALDMLKKLTSTSSTPSVSSEAQYGVVPYRIVDGQVTFLMITSRRNANWVFPKGGAIKGLTAAASAAQEAFEEAGIRGKVEPVEIGSYLHPRNSNANELVEVKMFPMLVTDQLDSWPEEPERFRHWALLADVRRMLANKDAVTLAARLNERLKETSDQNAQRKAR